MDKERKSRNRQLGAYYTPDYFAEAVACWGIRGKDETVLDPSFGGCAFLKASLNRLHSLGSRRPDKNLYGFDVDPSAFISLSALLGNYDRKRFIDDDFLSSKNGNYDVIIGNPPYIKYDNLPEKSLTRARLAVSREFGSFGRANYWAYFLVHSVELLKLGGRLGFILPTSFLESDYSGKIRGILSERFERIDVFPIRDQIFSGTSETTALVLCDKKSVGATCIFTIHEVLTSKTICKRIKSESFIQGEHENSDTSRIQAQKVLNNYVAKYNILGMRHYFDISIGIVTGDKKFFILDKDDAKTSGFSDFLRPVISKAQDLKDLIIDKKIVANSPHVLCIPTEYAQGGLYGISELDIYLDSAPKRTRNTSHALRRKPWYAIKSIYASSNIIKNVISGEVYIYYNQAQLLCTNNLLRLNAKNDFSPLSLAICSKTSLFQLSVYLSARRYGKGAVKIEPSTLTNTYIPYVNLENEYSLCQLEEISEFSIDQIDRLILVEKLGFENNEVALIRKALRNYKFKNRVR